MIIKRLAQLRQQMKEQNIDSYLILSGDFHASEYVGDYFKCREFISGFNGSAGDLVVTQEEAGLFTDGRYFLQAEEQLQGTGIKLFKQGEQGVPSLQEFVDSHLKENQCLGFDGRTVNANFITELQSKFGDKQISIRGDVDLVGEIWVERPAISKEPVWELGIKYAGISRNAKLNQIRRQMAKLGATHHIVSDLMDIAWIFNLRGNDIAYCPLFLAYAVIDKEQTIIFAHRECFAEELIKMPNIIVREYEEIYDYIKELGSTAQDNQVKVLLDNNKVNYALLKALGSNAPIINSDNPSTMLKAVKNEIEIANMRQAHIKDGVAIIKLWYWLSTKIDRAVITEISLGEKLEEFRRADNDYLGASFSPIIGYKGNGAIIHYSATTASDATIKPEGLLIMDVGGHYLWGSTDITRTINLGEPSKQQRQHYTAVLQGNIHLSKAIFAKGSKGVDLDKIAREPIRKLGLNYNHGTGHGVGYLLSVHEGPQVITGQGARANEIDFVPGMISSNEPGIYEVGEYGIRLENLILCQQLDEEGVLFGFETLTVVPFDLSLIDVDTLTKEEKQHLNNYHEKVYQTISPFLNKEENEWLAKMTMKV